MDVPIALPMRLHRTVIQLCIAFALFFASVAPAKICRVDTYTVFDEEFYELQRHFFLQRDAVRFTRCILLHAAACQGVSPIFIAFISAPCSNKTPGVSSAFCHAAACKSVPPSHRVYISSCTNKSFRVSFCRVAVCKGVTWLRVVIISVRICLCIILCCRCEVRLSQQNPVAFIFKPYLKEFYSTSSFAAA